MIPETKQSFEDCWRYPLRGSAECASRVGNRFAGQSQAGAWRSQAGAWERARAGDSFGGILLPQHQEFCRVKLSLESEEEYVGKKNLETFYRNPVGNEAHPEKAGHQPEANIA